MKLRCNACHGVYETIGADGVRYFHACPPLSVVDVERAGAKLAVPLSDLRDDDRVAIVRDGKRVLDFYTVAKFNGETVERRDVARPGARDENITIDSDGKVAMKAEGLGVVTHDDVVAVKE